MGMPGRKSWKEELNIAQRYADLTPKAFEVLSEMLESEEKQDRKWAVEQLSKGFQKMIPQVVEAPEEGFVLRIVSESADRYGVSQNTKTSSK